MKIAIIIAAGLILGVLLLRSFRKVGYRGAIGFKNRQNSEIATIRLTGFSKAVNCRTLAQREHSFNYLGCQSIPREVQIVWRLAVDTKDKTATIPLDAVPKDAADGEIFFVLSNGDAWSVEYAPRLQLEKLQNGE